MGKVLYLGANVGYFLFTLFLDSMLKEKGHQCIDEGDPVKTLSTLDAIHNPEDITAAIISDSGYGGYTLPGIEKYADEKYREAFPLRLIEILRNRRVPIVMISKGQLDRKTLKEEYGFDVSTIAEKCQLGHLINETIIEEVIPVIDYFDANR